MATTQQTFPEQLREERESARTVLTGSLAEGVVGGAVIVLALIGLSDIMPAMILPIAVIAMGAAFLLEGGTVSMRFSKLLHETSKDRFQEAELGVGVTGELLGGMTGLILGILALVGLRPLVLSPVAVIAFGATLLFGSGVTARLNALEVEGAGEFARYAKITKEAVTAAAGVELLLGLSAVILGIIALTGTHASTLSLVAILIVGISGFVNGAAITARMINIFRK